NRRQRVRHIVSPHQAQVDIAPLVGGNYRKPRAIQTSLDYILRTHVYTIAHSVQHRTLAHASAKGRDALIVAVQKRYAVRGQRFHQLILGACDPVDTIRKKLQVHRRNVRHDGPIWFRDLRQRADFAGVVHSHLQHRDLVFALQTQQLQWQTKMVVEVSLSLQHLELRAQNLRNALFGGRLARRAGDANHAPAPFAAHAVRELLHRIQNAVVTLIGNAQQRAFIKLRRRQPALTHDCCYRSIRDGGINVIVPIDALTFHREEQLPRADRARVDGVPHHLFRRIEDSFSMDPVCNLSQRQRHRAPSCAMSRRMRAASATSSNGTGPSAKICSFSCPLPASRTISPGFAARIATSIAARRSSSTTNVAPVSRTPGRASLMISIGSSLRGLSLVTMTRSLSAPATRPIFGRFVLSRSPPQPNIVITRPPCSPTRSRASSMRFFRASSVCA